jgi:hypothetical protein
VHVTKAPIERSKYKASLDLYVSVTTDLIIEDGLVEAVCWKQHTCKHILDANETTLLGSKLCVACLFCLIRIDFLLSVNFAADYKHKV